MVTGDPGRHQVVVVTATRTLAVVENLTVKSKPSDPQRDNSYGWLDDECTVHGRDVLTKFRGSSPIQRSGSSQTD